MNWYEKFYLSEQQFKKKSFLLNYPKIIWPKNKKTLKTNCFRKEQKY